MDVFGVFIVCQGEFHPKLAANLTLAYVNANVAVGSLEVLDTANLLTLRLGYVVCRFVQSKPHCKSSWPPSPITPVTVTLRTCKIYMKI